MTKNYKPLTEKQYKKRQERLDKYNRIKNRGFFFYTLTNALKITLIIEIILIFFIAPKSPAKINPLLFGAQCFFPAYFFICCIVAMTWLGFLSRIELVKKELSKKIKIGTEPVEFALFIILAILSVFPIIFKDQFAERDKKANYELNESKLAILDHEFSLEPLENNLQFTNGTSVTLTAPKAYFIFGNSYKKEGVLTDILATSKIDLAAKLPDLEPWKLTKETLEKTQERYDSLRTSKYIELQNDRNFSGESIIYRMLIDDPNLISINLIDFFPASDNEVLKIRNKLHHGRANEEYEKYGLHIYDIEVAIPSELEGKSVYFYKNGLIADIIKSDSYPPMIFACETVCTIISNYHDKFGLAVSFNASQLDKWQDIWLKANSKIDSMIKWQ